MKSFNEPFGAIGLKSADATSKHRTALRIFWSLLGTLMLVALLPAVPAAANVHLAVSSGSVYTAVTPVRLMDTRSSTKLGAGGTRNLTVTGGLGAPVGATAVVLNVTVTNTTATSFLTVYPTGTTRPLASNLNWTAGKTIPNLVEVPVGSGGQVTFFNAAGSTDVIADLEGSFNDPSGNAGGHVALTPARITDTRTNSGKPNAGSHLAAGSTLDIMVNGQGGVPNLGVSGGLSGVSGVILNFTVTNTTATSFLTVWPTGATRPTASNLNWVAGLTIANRVFVPVDPVTGKVSVYNSAGSTDVIVDVSGYFTDSSATGAPFTPQIPVRIADTRSSGTTLGAGSTLTLQVGGVAGVPTDASAVILNVTATNTTATSFLTVYPSTASSRPTASDQNWTAGVTIPNLVVAKLGTSGAIKIFNSAGQADVVVDLFGYFQVPPVIPPPPAPVLTGATINVGTKTITVAWSQTVDCPTGSAGQFSFSDQYPGPGKAASSTVFVTATAVASVGATGSQFCTVTFGSEPRNFGNNDTGSLHYQQPPSPTIINAVNNANGFAPSGSQFAMDLHAPNLSGVSALVGSATFQVLYDDPISCSGSVPAMSNYTVTLNGGADAVTGVACVGGFLSQTRTINVTVATAPTATSDAWTLTSNGGSLGSVFDFQGNHQPSGQSKAGFAVATRIHLTAIAATIAGSGNPGTITLTFSSSVDCSSIAPDTTDFTVVDDFVPQNVPLTSVASCSGITVVYNYTAPSAGVFGGDTLTATAQFGSDGDVVVNSLGTQWEVPGDNASVTL